MVFIFIASIDAFWTYLFFLLLLLEFEIKSNQKNNSEEKKEKKIEKRIKTKLNQSLAISKKGKDKW